MRLPSLTSPMPLASSKPSSSNRHPILPWSLMAGMRDHLIHGYDAIDLDEVWNTATRDVPEVLAKIAPILPQQPGTSP